jgi:GT2 family glycosyltransferase
VKEIKLGKINTILCEINKHNVIKQILPDFRGNLTHISVSFGVLQNQMRTGNLHIEILEVQGNKKLFSYSIPNNTIENYKPIDITLGGLLINKKCYLKIWSNTNLGNGVYAVYEPKKSKNKFTVSDNIITGEVFCTLNFKETHFKKSDFKIFNKITKSKKIQNNNKNEKLGVGYNIFNGEELLESSILSIRENVDYIVVVVQFFSNFGKQSSDELIGVLSDLKSRNLIDQIVHYNSDTASKPWVNELRKRQMGLDACRSVGCTHFMTMDADEIYEEKQFINAKKMIYTNDYDSSACQMRTYYHSPEFQLYPPEEYYVPFIFKIQENVNFRFAETNFPVLADPTRKLSATKCKVFNRNELEMHHLSYVRKNFRCKIENSTAAPGYQGENSIEKVIEHYENWKYPMQACTLLTSPKYWDIVKVDNIIKKIKTPKVSIIIPTLLKIDLDFFKTSIENYLSNPLVNEIIIIDNTKKKECKHLKFLQDNRIKIIAKKENLFVNPAWNYGAAIAKNDYMIFINDDIFAASYLIDKALHYIKKKDIGVVTYAVSHLGNDEKLLKKINVSNQQLTSIDEYKKIIKKIHADQDEIIVNGERRGMWFMINKKDWKKIPKNFKIWYGDDIIFEHIKSIGKKSIQIYPHFVYHCHGGKLTTDFKNNTEHQKIFAKETEMYKKYKGKND